MIYHYFIVLIDVSSQLSPVDEADYTHNWFFIEQLQAFEVWLKYGGERRTPPQQLPVVLQVLLSQVLIEGFYRAAIRFWICIFNHIILSLKEFFVKF